MTKILSTVNTELGKVRDTKLKFGCDISSTWVSPNTAWFVFGAALALIIGMWIITKFCKCDCLRTTIGRLLLYVLAIVLLLCGVFATIAALYLFAAESSFPTTPKLIVLGFGFAVILTGYLVLKATKNSTQWLLTLALPLNLVICIAALGSGLVLQADPQMINDAVKKAAEAGGGTFSREASDSLSSKFGTWSVILACLLFVMGGVSGALPPLLHQHKIKARNTEEKGKKKSLIQNELIVQKKDSERQKWKEKMEKKVKADELKQKKKQSRF